MSGVNTASMIAATKVIPANMPKPRVNAALSLPANSPVANPAIKLPMEMERNHTPSISPTILCGDSLVVVLRPTGLKQSSPMVCRK